MKKFAVVWKNIGETPLEATETFRRKEGLSPHIPLAYAGRLDPMAAGKLIVLIGDECKKLKDYTNLDKEYTFEILFGFSSDTGDVLGIAEASSTHIALSRAVIQSAARKFLGTHTFQYPLFSSKTVQGKPLYKWTLENRLHEITIPTREANMYRIRVFGVEKKTKKALQEEIEHKIQQLTPVTDPEKGWGTDFRREPILKRWRELLTMSTEKEFHIARARAIVSSGTYIRTIAEHIGHALHTKSLAYSIVRNSIGTYTNLGLGGFYKKKF